MLRLPHRIIKRLPLLMMVALTCSLMALMLAVRRRSSVVLPTVPLMPLDADSVSEATWQMVTAGGQRVGPLDAEVEIVIFTDYDCHFCAAADSILDRLLTEFSGKLAVIYRNFPLSTHFRHSYAEARVAVCAARVGKFEAVQSLLYNEPEFTPVDIAGMASALGVSQNSAFASCTRGIALVPEIEGDLQVVRALGTNRTPTMFLSGRLLSRTPYADELRLLIDQRVAGGR